MAFKKPWPIAWVEPTAPFWATLSTIPAGLSGIYAFLHTPTSRMYVGATGDIRGRCQQHLGVLRWRGYGNPGLSEAWERDGPFGFHFIVLEPVPNELRLHEREIFWIKRLNALAPHGLNRRRQVDTLLSPSMARLYTRNNTEWDEYWNKIHTRIKKSRERRQSRLAESLRNKNK
jgi:hypothetical protein